MATSCRQPTGNPAIMVVDDDLPIRQYMYHILRRESYDVLMADNAPEALALLRSQQFSPDLLVTDFNMPDMNGIQLTRAVREAYPDLPVLLVSGAFSISASRYVNKNDGVYQLNKPFVADTLIKHIHRAIQP
mgnify:CR=1 FL=1